MTAKFLREVQLKNFRTFGEFTLPVPPGPGLTLVVGTNGLGKSTFFDGIEWCLTGSVRRLEDYVGRLKESEYLTRRDAVRETHQVRLTFSGGEVVSRGAHESTSTSELLRLLKNPEWTEIKDVGMYLGFTHFLGQASQQRFTSRQRTDQWEALKGPSGIERLDEIRTVLRGRATSLAFGRRVERENVAVKMAALALEKWQEGVARFAELRLRSEAAGAEDEASLESRLLAMEQVLPAGSVMSGDFLKRLASTRAVIESATQDTARSSAGIDELRAIVSRFLASSRLMDQNDSRLSAATVAVTAASAQLSEAMLAASEAEQAEAKQTEAVVRAEAEYEDRVRIQAAISELEVVTNELREAQLSEATLTAERDAAQSDVSDAQLLLSQVQKLRVALSKFDQEQASLNFWALRLSALQALEETVRSRRHSAATTKATAEPLQGQVIAFQYALKAAQEAEEAAEAKLAARRLDASDLAELLSGLVAHIDQDETDCPVCASRFPVGELHLRVRIAVGAQDARLADDVRALDELRDRARTAAEVLKHAEASISSASVALAAAKAAEAEVARERAAIAAGLSLDVDSDFASWIAERSAEISRSRTQAIGNAGTIALDVAAAQAHVGEASAVLISLDERLASASQRRTRCANIVRTIEDSLAGHPKPWRVDIAAANVETQHGLLNAARTSLEGCALARTTTARSEAVARERSAVAELERERIIKELQDAEVARTKAIEHWRKLGMEDEPTSPSLEAREAMLRKRTVALAGYIAECAALSRSFEAHLAQGELVALRTTLEAEGGVGSADNPVPYTQILQEKLQSARDSLRRTEAVRSAVVAYGDQLKIGAERFSTEFLLPLNDLIDGFNRVLLSAPGATVQFSAAHTVERTSLAMQLRYADAEDNSRYKTTLPPQLVLSEGQMAANGFSILCAASVAYPWSRWRALLLDDPLQHNDIIHAAAFVDVMRNLVEFERYQLIMSSHNRDEGEFIARKFDAAGLPCTVVELIGQSRAGVQAAAPRHNAAALTLLNRAEV